jgi:regulator of RNase E activity RraA
MFARVSAPDRPAWRAAPTAPAAAGAAASTPAADPHVEMLRAAQHPCWLLAYMRDLTRTLAPAVKSMNIESHPYFVGRAFTVSGPDVYLSALEGIPPGAVYVQGGCSPRDACFSPGWTHAYVKPRGGVAVVVDGGVYKSFECAKAAVPMFAAFATPSIAINRRHGRCGEDVACAGTVVGDGDIVVGDADGVVVIPRACEDELFAKMGGFVRGNGAFGKIAARALARGVPMTEEPALADMFERKYANPEAYWREYEGWWAKWRQVEGYADIDADGQNAAFYSK